MMIVLSRVVPREQLLVIHAPLGDIEWPGTIQKIESTIPAGVPLILALTASGKSLLERIEERGRFPSSSIRYCTSDTKRSPIERELRHHLKAHSHFGGFVINAMGMRASEMRAARRSRPMDTRSAIRPAGSRRPIRTSSRPRWRAWSWPAL